MDNLALEILKANGGQMSLTSFMKQLKLIGVELRLSMIRDLKEQKKLYIIPGHQEQQTITTVFLV